MDLRIERDSDVPLFRQIHRQIRDLILSGQLPEGFRLPPERQLARSLGVNRSTVLIAYRELKADGLVDAHVGRGTVVLPAAPDLAPAAPVPLAAPPPWRELVRSGARVAQEPLLRDLLEMTERHDVVLLSMGLPAPDLMPVDQISDTCRAVLARDGAAMLTYSPTEGLSRFRETIADLVARRGIRATRDDVLITSGSQQGLDLVVRAFVDPGDLVIVEEPTYFGALQVLRAAEARLVSVPTDVDGMRVDYLEALLQRQRPKLIYTLPTFQNPSGSVLSIERRRKLIALAERHHVPVLEDDPYSELPYDESTAGTANAAAPPPLKAFDASGHVIYLSSFSKVVSPALRVGFLVAPRPALRQLALVKQASDLNSSTLGQAVLDRFIHEGHYARHLERVRRAYRERRNAMQHALERADVAGLQWTMPGGGFYFWCRLPDRVAESTLIAHASEARVSFLPGSACFHDDPAHAYIRLNFSFPTPAEIREGVSRLASALRRSTRGARAAVRAAAAPPII
jgi:DNA-binding transcriptional MocR family regulator